MTAKRPHITLRERLRRLRDRDRPQPQPPTAHTNQQQPEWPSGVYPVVKPWRAWLTMRRTTGNRDAGGAYDCVALALRAGHRRWAHLRGSPLGA